MKQVHLISRVWAITMCSLLVLLSCIREDLSNCPPKGLRLFFSYTDKVNGPIGINPNDIEKVSVYVFGENGKYIGLWTDEAPQMNADYHVDLRLETGTYTFVCWGNLRTPYQTEPVNFVAGVTNIADAQLHLQRLSGDSINATLHPLFFGNLKQAAIRGDNNQTITIPLVQNTNKINITVRGLPPNGHTYGYTITDTNSKYQFDNSFAPDIAIHYTTTADLNEQDELVASLTIMRLATDRHPMLKVHNQTTDSLLSEHDLMELLTQAIAHGAFIDIEHMHEHDIVLTYGTDLSVSISVDGWIVTEDGEEELHG